jgi:uncharacterized RDD family membrane protein YckC
MSSPQTATIPEVGQLYANLGARLGAWSIDVLVALVTVVAAAITMQILRASGLWTPTPWSGNPESEWRTMAVGSKFLIVAAFFISTGVVYGALFEASPWQATLGKRVMKIYVIDAHAFQRLTLTRSSVRWVARYVCTYVVGWLISLILVATKGKKQALHDLVAGTLVFKGRPVPGGSLESWRLVAAFLGPFLMLIVVWITVL